MLRGGKVTSDDLPNQEFKEGDEDMMTAKEANEMTRMALDKCKSTETYDLAIAYVERVIKEKANIGVAGVRVKWCEIDRTTGYNSYCQGDTLYRAIEDELVNVGYKVTRLLCEAAAGPGIDVAW